MKTSSFLTFSVITLSVFFGLSMSTAEGQTGGAVSVTQYGATGNGANAAGTTAAFSAAFAANPNGKILVPPGDYLINNGGGALTVQNFGGELEFQGRARLVFTDNTRGGLWFLGGTGARITGLRATYATAPYRRNSPQEQIKFSSTTDTMLRDTVVENSPAAGILFYDSVRPKVVNATVLNSMADGLHFANCQDAEVTNLTTTNTGDDGLAFVNYSQYPNKTGGMASNVVIRNAKARGIAVVGQSDVTIHGFMVEGTSSSGLLCATDSAYGTRVPANVSFSSGLVKNAGSLGNQVGNNYGIEYNYQTSCTFSDIQVLNAAGRGLAGMAPSGSVTVSNVTVKQNGSGEAFSFYQTAQVTVTNSTAENSPGYGFFFAMSNNVLAKSVVATNTSTMSSLRRAIWFENNSSVVAADLLVTDTQPTATGYIVGAYQAGVAQNGVVNGVTTKIVNGTGEVQSNSTGLLIRNIIASK